MTATAVGLFLVLLGILFTNLVRCAAAQPQVEPSLPRAFGAFWIQRAVLFQHPVLGRVVFTVLLTLSRWYRDSEMIVWVHVRARLTNWLRPIPGLPALLLAIVALSLGHSPWAEQRRLEYERQLESRDDLSLLAPGLFKEFRQARLVVFIESFNSFDGTIRNVFLHSIEGDKDVTTVARSGRLEEAPNGDRFIVLQDGRRYEGQPGSAEFRTAEFERLGRRIEPAEARAAAVAEGAALPALLQATARPSAPRSFGGYRCRSALSCWCCSRSRCRMSIRG